jgi:hypothetical protein
MLTAPLFWAPAFRELAARSGGQTFGSPFGQKIIQRRENSPCTPVVVEEEQHRGDADADQDENLQAHISNIALHRLP